VKIDKSKNEDQGTTTHRYHAAVLEAFRRADNPLKGILGGQEAQDILWAWKRWRNKWVKKDVDGLMEAVEDLRRVGVDMPVLCERLRESVSTANALARKGVQIIQLTE